MFHVQIVLTHNRYRCWSQICFRHTQKNRHGFPMSGVFPIEKQVDYCLNKPTRFNHHGNLSHDPYIRIIHHISLTSLLYHLLSCLNRAKPWSKPWSKHVKTTLKHLSPWLKNTESMYHWWSETGPTYSTIFCDDCESRCHGHQVAQGKGGWSALLGQQWLGINQDLVAALGFPGRGRAPGEFFLVEMSFHLIRNSMGIYGRTGRDLLWGNILGYAKIDGKMCQKPGQTVGIRSMIRIWLEMECLGISWVNPDNAKLMGTSWQYICAIVTIIAYGLW